jgi:hypothetical protein
MSKNSGLSNIRRRCSNKEMRKLLMAALATGVRYKTTKNGIIIYAEDGQIAGTHFTCSDNRAVKNFRRDLARIGIHTKG